MGLDDAFHDREAQTCAGAAGRPRLPETIEQMRLMLAWDTRTGVGDPEEYGGLLRFSPKRDAPPWPSELDGVTQKVVEDLKEAAAIRPDIRKVVRQVEAKLESAR